MVKKKKVGSAGRFGPRYGRRPRKRVADVEKIQKEKYICPVCEKKKLVREASGIWVCRKCGTKIAGGAYQPLTEATKIVKQSLLKLKREE